MPKQSTEPPPAELLAGLQAENQRLRAVIDAVAQIGAARDVDAALDAVLDAAEDVFRAQRSLILLTSPGSHQRTIRRARGLSAAHVAHLATGHVPVQRLLEAQGLVTVSDLFSSPLVEISPAITELLQREGFRGFCAAALEHAGQRLGALVIYYDEPHEISESEAQLARLFAGLAAQALAQAQDFELMHRLQAEREESFARLQAILDRIRDQVIVWTPEMEILVANEAARQFIAAQAAEGARTVPARCLPDPDNCPVHQVFREGRPVVGCEVMIGEQVFAIDCHPLLDTLTGELLAVVEHCRDATVNHRLQRQLADNERRMRVAMETAPVGILDVLLPSGTIARANHKMAQFCGQPVEELLGRSVYDLFHPEDRAAFEEAWETCDESREAVAETVRLLRSATGLEPLPASVTLGRFAYSDGELHGHMVIKDVSQRLRLQAQLLEQEKLAAIGQLASGVAHELRNPIGIIASALYDLEEILATDDPDVLEDLSIARAEIQRVQEIINNVLDLARGGQAEREWVNLAEDLQRAAAIYPKSLASRDVELIVDLQPTPDLWAHRVGLRQIILNLIQNAFQATPDGGKVSVSLAPDGPEHVRLAIRDTGEGIPPEALNQIFNPFYTTKAPGRGTGLGLSIVHTIVQDHGGTIEVDSTVGQGTCFTVTLPREAATPTRRERTRPLFDAAIELL